MVYILACLWVLMWSLTGYFTVKAILAHIEKKRTAKAIMALRYQQAFIEKRAADVCGSKQITYNPFEGIL